MKFLACKWHFVIATKSSPAAALDPFPGADPAIVSIILTTEPISTTEELKAFSDIDRTCKCCPSVINYTMIPQARGK